MQTVPQTPSSEQFLRNVADLYGDRDTPAAPPAWTDIVAHVSAELCQKLRLDAPNARLAKALQLVLAHAVTLNADGSASVLGATRTYSLAPHCPCPDARNRSELCKHALAVELHKRALALLDGTAPAPTPTPAAPTPAPTVPTSSTWQVHEAPVSACFRFRLGQGELTYTLRGIDDTEVLDRIHAHLPFLHAILDGWETRAAERAAARDAAIAHAHANAQAQAQAQAPVDMPGLAQQLLQQLLAAQVSGAATNGHPNGHTLAGAPSCPAHGAMRESTKSPGTWFCAHKLADGSFCPTRA